MQYELPDLNTDEALQLAHDLGHLDIVEPFTFSANMKWVRPFGMLVSLASIKQFRNKYTEIPFNMVWNTDYSGVNYAAHMGFFKAISERIDVGKMPGEACGNCNYIPITELDLHQIHRNEIDNGNYIVMGDAIEKESSRLARILSRDNRELQSLLTYLIREILRNIPEHAECNKAWICGQYWSNHSAEIAILDEGIGIKSSLQQNSVHREYIDSDEDALIYSIKAGISQSFKPEKKNASDDPWANSGFGLYMVSEICKELGGSFCLATGKKYIYVYSDGSHKIGDTDFNGTAVKVTISTDGIVNSQAIINKIAKQGEAQAKTIRNAFKQASMPSKGLISKL